MSGWSRCDLAMRVLAISPEESKVIFQIVSAVIHLGAAGVTRGMLCTLKQCFTNHLFFAP